MVLASLVPRRLSKWSFPASLVPPRQRSASPGPPGLSTWPFPPPWCLPAASQAFQMVLSCLLVPPWCLGPPWCLQVCPNGPFCLPGASQAVQMVLSCLPGASLVPRRLSNWSESRFWTGAGFCLNFSTTSMANGPVRGKSWDGLHGRLPVAQAGP